MHELLEKFQGKHVVALDWTFFDLGDENLIDDYRKTYNIPSHFKIVGSDICGDILCIHDGGLICVNHETPVREEDIPITKKLTKVSTLISELLEIEAFEGSEDIELLKRTKKKIKHCKKIAPKNLKEQLDDVFEDIKTEIDLLKDCIMIKQIPDILTEIVAHKRLEAAKNKELYPVKLLEKSTFYDSPCVSLKEYILRKDKSGIITEFKRKSPSKNAINLYADPEEVTIGYMQAGASALSVLTDEKYFGGSTKDLTTARKFNYCPILRKDFIIDEYQIIEAKSIGADAILLIAEILSKEELEKLTEKAHELGMEVLCELHSEEMIEKLPASVDLIGVNNRDLKTFTTSIENSIRIKKSLPKDKVLISESGIHSAEQLIQLRNAGFHGFLIGELFMKEEDPGAAARGFVNEVSG